MKDIEITNLNVFKYQRLLEIKQGKRVPNDKCIWIPTSLILLEGIGAACLVLWSAFLDPYMPALLADCIQLVSYCGILFGIAKVNFGISKKMGVRYFIEQNPEIDVDISTEELKQKLIQYRLKHTPKRHMRELEKSIYQKKLSSKEKVKALKAERTFLTKYKESEKEEQDVEW